MLHGYGMTGVARIAADRIVRLQPASEDIWMITLLSLDETLKQIQISVIQPYITGKPFLRKNSAALFRFRQRLK